MPTVSVSCWQAIALATHSNIVRNRGGFRPRNRSAKRPEVRIVRDAP